MQFLRAQARRGSPSFFGDTQMYLHSIKKYIFLQCHYSESHKHSVLLFFDTVLNASYFIYYFRVLLFSKYHCSAYYVEGNRNYLDICIKQEKNTQEIYSQLNESILNMIPLGFGKCFAVQQILQENKERKERS